MARALGPFVKYRSGPKAGQLVAPDVESWFQQDRYQGDPHIVAQWADLHNSSGPGMGHGRSEHGGLCGGLGKGASRPVVEWIKEQSGNVLEPKAADLAVLFFEDFSRENPGRFPSAVCGTGPTAKSDNDRTGE